MMCRGYYHSDCDTQRDGVCGDEAPHLQHAAATVALFLMKGMLANIGTPSGSSTSRAVRMFLSVLSDIATAMPDARCQK